MAYEDMTAPQFAGTPPTEGARIRNGGRVIQEQPTGAPIAHTPMASADPDSDSDVYGVMPGDDESTEYERKVS